jgi:hypothetical protein
MAISFYPFGCFKSTQKVKYLYLLIDYLAPLTKHYIKMIVN